MKAIKVTERKIRKIKFLSLLVKQMSLQDIDTDSNEKREVMRRKEKRSRWEKRQ